MSLLITQHRLKPRNIWPGRPCTAQLQGPLRWPRARPRHNACRLPLEAPFSPAALPRGVACCWAHSPNTATCVHHDSSPSSTLLLLAPKPSPHPCQRLHQKNHHQRKILAKTLPPGQAALISSLILLMSPVAVNNVYNNHFTKIF